MGSAAIIHLRRPARDGRDDEAANPAIIHLRRPARDGRDDEAANPDVSVVLADSLRYLWPNVARTAGKR